MDTLMEQKLAKANQLRESEQYGESAKLYTECLLELQQKDDPQGMIHCLGGQSLIYKIKARENSDPLFRRLTSSFAREAYLVGQTNKSRLDGRTLSIAYSTYASALLVEEKFAESLAIFEESFAVSTADKPEKGRLKAHIGGLKYRLGEREVGLNLLNEALADIRTGDLSDKTIRTWETGAMHELAKIYASSGDRAKAEEIATEALAIASSHDLPIRKREAENLLKQITSGDNIFSL